MTERQVSGREILLRQQEAGKQFYIDCSLAMMPGWITALREAAAGNQKILDALNAVLDNPSQITPDPAGS